MGSLFVSYELSKSSYDSSPYWCRSSSELASELSQSGSPTGIFSALNLGPS